MSFVTYLNESKEKPQSSELEKLVDNIKVYDENKLPNHFDKPTLVASITDADFKSGDGELHVYFTILGIDEKDKDGAYVYDDDHVLLASYTTEYSVNYEPQTRDYPGDNSISLSKGDLVDFEVQEFIDDVADTEETKFRSEMYDYIMNNKSAQNSIMGYLDGFIENNDNYYEEMTRYGE